MNWKIATPIVVALITAATSLVTTFQQGESSQSEIVTLAVTTAATVQTLEQRIHELEDMLGPHRVMATMGPPMAGSPREEPEPPTPTPTPARTIIDGFKPWIQQAPPNVIRETGLNRKER